MDERYESRRQKQPFADIPQDRCSRKFRKFHRNILVLESLSNKVADPNAAT